MFIVIGCKMADTQSENVDGADTSEHFSPTNSIKEEEIARPVSAKSDEEAKSKINELRTALTEVLGEENLTAQSTDVNEAVAAQLDNSSSNQSNNATSDQQADSNPDAAAEKSASDSSLTDKSSKYTAPIDDPYEKAWKYLSKHNILALFGTITADIVYGKPDDPLEFMIDEIEKLQEQDRVRKGVIKRTASAALSNDKPRPEHEKSILDELPT